MTENTLTIVVPAYNEGDSLKTYVTELTEFCKKNSFFLIIVNDGSKDETKEVLNAFTGAENILKVIHHKVNKGYGGAIKSGVLAAETKYIITVDADGQHMLEDVLMLYNEIISNDAEMIVGCRKGQPSGNFYRRIGKSIIRGIARWLMPLHIYDINSGMKIYNTALAKKYISLCPDSMAYSDIIALIFISQKHLVLEKPIRISPRKMGKSTISLKTAIDTVMEIMNIVVLFNPMRLFFPISIISIIAGLAWGIPFIIQGKGVSAGMFLAIITGLIFFLLGLLAEQLSMLRKNNIK
jgi:glycosyltransferase involved in cell wall biosynthesis